MLTDFQNSFTYRLSGKFAIRSLWNIPCSNQKERCCSRTPSSHATDVQPVTDGISRCVKLGHTSLTFVDPGDKVNGAYYRNVLLLQQLLPTIRQVSGEFFIFQQDSAPAHRARETVFWNVRHLRLSRQICGLQTAQTLTQLTTKSGA